MVPVARRLSLLILLALGAPGMALAQARPGPRISVRQANEEILLAQLRMNDVYREVRASVGDDAARGDCDELTGEDCFAGDRECQACLWSKDRRDMIRLGIRFDSIAAMVARAPRGVRPDRLNWLSAQRVGVWARLENSTAAARAAQECLGALWLCEGLKAFVEHMQGKHEQAGQRFSMLLRVMPADQSCQWRDLRLFHDSTGNGIDALAPVRLIGTLPRGYRKPECRSHEEMQNFWTLSDPLFTMPGNDRMTEHYARLVDLLIHELHLDAFSYGCPRPHRHRFEHHSKMLRHGWPTQYEFKLYRADTPATRNLTDGQGRAATFSGDRGGGPSACMDPYAGYSFLTYGNGGQTFMMLSPVADAMTAYPEMFATVRERPIETYRPAYGSITGLPVQSGFFRRSGESILLLRTRAPVDGPRLRREWQLRSWNGRAWRDGVVQVAADTVIGRVVTPWETQVASLEALHVDGAWRARTGTRPPASRAVTLSSLVLLDAATEPVTLDDVARAMLPGDAIAPGQRVTGYWELYTPQTRTAAIELRIRHTSPGLAARALGVGRRPDHVIRWTEELRPSDGVVARTIGLDLGAVESGDYEVSLTMTLDDGTQLTTSTRARRLD
jgi:hypothetical protein